MDLRFCQVCSRGHSEDDPVHNNTPLHRFNFLLFEWNKYRKALVRNRHGIEVKIEPIQVNGHVYNTQEEYKKGKLTLKMSPESFVRHNNNVEFQCTIKNAQKDKSIVLTSAILLHPYKLYSLTDPNNNIGLGGLGNNRYPELEAGAEYSVIVKFTNENVVVGSYKIPVSFSFQTVGETPDTFTIARAIIVSIEEHSLEDEAPTKSPFTNYDWPANVEIIPATQSQRYHDMYPIAFHRYNCFKYGLQEFNRMGGIAYTTLSEIRREMEPGHVTKQNYREFWHNVLWLEEMGQILMLKRYNMEKVTMGVMGGDRLELVVPGLAEKRPSVIVGDMVEIRVHEAHKGYKGIIKNVNDKTVDIAYVNGELLELIRAHPEIELDVRFLLSRLPLERMHQGVDQTVINGNIPTLFPDDSLRRSEAPITRTIRDSEFLNQQIVANKEQKTAVLKILNATSKNAPYIVFGPPGTGKTITIVEAILQIKKKTTLNILVCAPANAACDMLTEKLKMHCSKEELIRIMSETVDTQSISQHILNYTNFQDGMFRKILPQELMQYRIVVTTLILVGRYTRKYSPDVVFIDEAAQACEPEVDCAVGMLEMGKQIVLAGDPRQLGPSPASKVAEKYGLGKSLLERLMDLELYQTLDPNFITMLKLNFRSHSTILQIPNELFYDNQLQAVSTKAENDPLARVSVYDKIQGGYQGGRKSKKNKKTGRLGQAIEFCSIISKECRQGRSPSYFNTKEMQMVLKYIEALLQLQFNDDVDRVLPEQIGVVTPYIRQVYKIRTLLRQHNFEAVEVGTTETFQGREKRIIIISTVRAQQDLLLYDKKYNLGFVRNEKRFNVALTRAMSKLIVIGCAHVLGTDSKWEAYLELCEDKGSFFGAPYAKRTQDVIDDITGRFGRIKLLDSQHNH